jgi:dihydroorotate dehydrogenase electron transfer subunit
MTPVQHVMTGKILSQEEILPGHRVLRISVAPGTFGKAVPGQFVMIRRKGEAFPFLFRPFSVHSLDGGNGEEVVGIFYRVVGGGTEIFGRMTVGEELSLIGPLGRGFAIPPGRKNVVLVGGGMGAAPLYFLARSLAGFRKEKGASVAGYFGCGNSDFVPVLERFAPFCSTLRISTDDGSFGRAGTVIDLLMEDLGGFDPAATVLCGCGPRPMLRRLLDLGRAYGTACQVSVEEKMACGVGACLGCVIPVKTGGGERAYRRACTEGPVFTLEELEGGADGG